MSHQALGEQFHPHVQQYRSGGIGHLDGDDSRSTVAFVPTHALEPYREHDGNQQPGHPTHDRKVIDGIRADIRAGRGITEPIQLFHDPKLNWGTVGEGNHRLAAAREEGIPVVPVRAHSRAARGGAKENGIGAPLELSTKWKGGVGEDYFPPDVHPLHFAQFKDA